MWRTPKYLTCPMVSLLIEDSDSSRLSDARYRETQGFHKDTEGVGLPRCSTVPCHFEPAQVHRRVLFVIDILVENFVSIKRSEHVLL